MTTNLLAAGKVRPKHRKLAEQMDRDTRFFQHLGIKEAARASWKATMAVAAAYKRSPKDYPAMKLALRKELWKGVPLLAQGMMVGFLHGYLREHKLADLTLSAYDDSTEWLEQRLNLPKDKMDRLEAKFSTKALWMYKGASFRVEKKLEKAMTRIQQDGLPVRQGVMELHKAFDRAGIMPNNSFTLEALYRTNIALAYSAGRRKADQSPAIQDILWGYQYCTVGDDRVRPNHAAMEGVTLPKEHEFWETWFPPAGWACRCVALSLFSENEEVEPVEDLEPDEGFDFDPADAFDDVEVDDGGEEEEAEQEGEAVEQGLEGGEDNPWAAAVEKELGVYPSEVEVRNWLRSLSLEEQQIVEEDLGIDLDDLLEGGVPEEVTLEV